MRRSAILGAVVLGSTVLAAIGLAQSGFRGQREATSLVDRLTALRQSMAGDAPAAAGQPSDDMQNSGGPERSVLSAPGAGFRPQSPPQSQREASTEAESPDRPRRPRLLSQLDPFNLLSRDDDQEETPAQQAEPAPRSAPPFRAPAAMDRRAMPMQREGVSIGPITQSPAEQSNQVRRSPLAHRAEESLPSSAVTRRETTGVALGPAGVAEQSLAPATTAPPERSVVVQDVDASQLPPATVSPVEQPLSPPGNDSWSVASDRYANSTPQEAATTTTRQPLVPAEESVLPITEEEIAQAPTRAEVAQETIAGPADSDVAQDAGGVARYRSEPIDATAPAPMRDGNAPTAPRAVNQATGIPPATSMRGEDVLSSDQAPAVAWEVTGPRQVIIGRGASFEIRLRNDGEDAASRLVARIDIPTSAEIASAESSHGVSQRNADGANSSVLEWRIEQLPAAREAVLNLTVIPRTNQVMNLEVSVRSEPQAAVARVEVLEPKLRLALEGPADLLHGEVRTYRLTVSNPGTGSAENVVVLFTPPGQDDRSAMRHDVGLLTAGASKTIELEITPEQAGELTMKAVAGADGDLRDLAERRVLVRKPELVVDARGPKSTYAGTVATYYFRVQNTGDATANDVTVQTHLPHGAEFVRAIDDRKTEAVANKETVTWRIGTLRPDEETFMELKCVVNWAGENTLELAAVTAGNGLQENKSISTHVVALADLKLEVADPQGPVAVGKEAIYEVRIKNRGSNTAEQINVAALFSEGIDPVSVEGGQHSIENGRVAFRMIESLAADREIVLKIRAVANEPGTHVFRAEVLCRELETKLAAEETTRFYRDEATAIRSDEDVRAAMGAEMFDTQ